MAWMRKDSGSTFNGGEELNVIGQEAFVHGSMAVRGSLRIEGEMEGNITDALEVVIGKNGRVRGNVSAERVEISGKVVGDVVCLQHLQILSCGSVVGNVRTPKLLVEDGAVLDGNCAMAESRNEQPTVAQTA